MGIVDAALLRRVEADLSQAALADLGIRSLPGRYDLNHLCAFHREIFSDLYPWAGEIRVVGIAKSDPFCLPPHIASYGAEVFTALAADGYLRGRTGSSSSRSWPTIWPRSTRFVRSVRATVVLSERSSVSSGEKWGG